VSERFCEHCDGRGTVIKRYDEYGMADPKEVPCPFSVGYEAACEDIEQAIRARGQG
jgi:hypothetical protein